MSDLLAAKRALARLADPSPVTEAERALRDLDRAVAFRASGGLDRLRATAARGGDRAARATGLVRAFDRFERAAAGEPVTVPDHFRRGRDTHLPGGG